MGPYPWGSGGHEDWGLAHVYIYIYVHANLARLYTAFSTYHSLRKLHTEQITKAISSGNFNSGHETAIELIQLFLAESCLATSVLMHNS